MHGKGQEKHLQHSAVSSFFKLKLYLIYRCHLYFKPVHAHITYQELTYLKSHHEFYEDISITKGLRSEKMIRFSDILEIQGENESVTEKNK